MRGHFSYSFNKRTEVMHYTKRQARLSWLSFLLSSSDTEKPFHVDTLKIVDKDLKNHDIILGKTPADKG